MNKKENQSISSKEFTQIEPRMRRGIETNFTDELKEKIIEQYHNLTEEFSALCNILESELWKNAFNSRELARNIIAIKHFNELNISGKKKEELNDSYITIESIKNVKAGAMYFEKLKNDILYFSNSGQSLLQKSNDIDDVVVGIALVLILSERLCEFQHIVFLSQEYLINNNQKEEWKYVSEKTLNIFKQMFNCYTDTFNKILKGV